ncbi:hydrogenase small subunit [Geobacter hydrogenophilus]|uniref:Ni/Fe hydrogenase n=1 Tax=Geobacter hydrogenophilus TaxID=40983 RepID=A0A9W6LB90_9BACT|nr:hydrogenase small subunit [Geobacter hydrogenophilus]MBT0893478.1 hydrogenase small subunit [Geobacter hydrogenophilus]GLI37827.1 Ni/Fe hydrogenase [Geobacter hydrogenophilus]
MAKNGDEHDEMKQHCFGTPGLWEERGVSRRDFLKFCTAMSAALALPVSLAPRIAEALESDSRPSVIWLEFQSCTGDTEALLRAANPTVGEIVLDVLSVDYAETIMAAAGHQAEEARLKTLKERSGKYIAVVEGAIPMKDNGVYCCVGGRSAVDIAREVCGGAMATITVGTCASYGGIPAASPNPTGAVGVKDAVPGATVINLPGCPVNTDNLVATVVHILTFGKLPATDSKGRPLFAYGKRIHDNCERRPHFDAGQYVEQWGDQAHRAGHCLYKMGCKGPETFHNCPTQRYNEKTNWPVGSGHGCAGCSEPHFWDTMTPFYRRLPNVPGFGVEATADKIGLGVAAATAAAFGIHGVVSALRKGDESDAGKEG